MRGSMVAVPMLLLLLLPLLFPAVDAGSVDFSQWKTCSSCIEAGHGWCPIRRVCGGFANRECGEGEKYRSADYGEEKQDKKKKKKKKKRVPDAELPDVIPLKKGNFKSEVLKGHHMWLVDFYAPWCGHCKALAPEYEKAAKILRGIVKVGAVDGDAEADLPEVDEIDGYPTIKFYGVNKKKPIEYDGPNTAEAIVEWVTARMKKTLEKRSGAAVEVQQEEVQEEVREEVVEEPPPPEPVVAAPEPEVAEAEAEAEVEKTAEEPWKNSDDDDGKKKKKKKKKGKKKKKKKKKIVPGGGDNVQQIGFDELSGIEKGKQVWMVHFYEAEGETCSLLAAPWSQAASSTKGMVNFGSIEWAAHPELSGSKYTQGSVWAFIPGSKPERYGGPTEGAALAEFASSKVPKPEVPQLMNKQQLAGCMESKLCGVLILPHLSDTTAVERREALSAAVEAARLVHAEASFVWSEYTSHVELERQFEVVGVPSLVLISKEKRAGTSDMDLPEPFSSEALAAAVLQADPADFPSSFKSVALSPSQPSGAWDGSEYVYPAL